MDSSDASFGIIKRDLNNISLSTGNNNNNNKKPKTHQNVETNGDLQAGAVVCILIDKDRQL